MATYDADTKAKALALAEEIGVSAAARRLGIPAGTIKAWRNRSGVTATATARRVQPQSKPRAEQKATEEPAREAARDSHGRWLPGVSGNPSGKRAETREAHRKAQEAAPEAVDTILGIMRDPKASAKARLEAAREILDRAMGRPKQSVDLDVEGVSTNVAVNILHLDATQVEAARRELLGRIDRLAATRGAMARAGSGDRDE